MTDILQLPGWEATGTRTEQGEFIIEAKYNVPATACIKCGVVGALYRHGTKKVRLRDSPVRGLPAVLDGTVQRSSSYLSSSCARTLSMVALAATKAARMASIFIGFSCRLREREPFIERFVLRMGDVFTCPYAAVAAPILYDELTGPGHVDFGRYPLRYPPPLQRFASAVKYWNLVRLSYGVEIRAPLIYRERFEFCRRDLPLLDFARGAPGFPVAKAEFIVAACVDACADHSPAHLFTDRVHHSTFIRLSPATTNTGVSALRSA